MASAKSPSWDPTGGTVFTLLLIAKVTGLIAAAWVGFYLKTGSVIHGTDWFRVVTFALIGAFVVIIPRAILRGAEAKRIRNARAFLASSPETTAAAMLALAALVGFAITPLPDMAEASALELGPMQSWDRLDYLSRSSLVIFLLGLQATLVFAALAAPFRAGGKSRRGKKPPPPAPATRIATGSVAGVLGIVVCYHLVSDITDASLRARVVSGDDQARAAAVVELGDEEDARGVPQLITALGDSTPDVRFRAAESLGTIADTRACEGLRPLLDDPEPRVRAAAARSLGIMADADAAKSLTAHLADDDAEVRASATDALANIGAPAALDLLSARMSENPDVRNAANAALAKILEREGTPLLVASLARARERELVSSVTELLAPRGDEAAELLTTIVGDTSETVRVNTARALGKTESARAVAPLIALTGNERQNVRMEAARSLGVLGGDAAVDTLRTLCTDGDARIRGAAIDALGMAGSEEDFDVLVKSLKDREHTNRGSAARAIGAIGGEKAIRILIKDIEDLGAVKAATEALGSTGADAVELLITTLLDESSRAQDSAALALGKIGDARAVVPLIDRLGQRGGSSPHALKALVSLGATAVDGLVDALTAPSRGDPTRATCAQALGLIKDPRAVEPLAARLTDGAWNVQRHARDALVHIGPPAVHALAAALAVENDKARRLAAEALNEIAAPEAKDAFITGLTDTTSIVRAFCAEGLGKLGDTTVTLHLVAALHDESVSVARAAARSLGALEAADAAGALRVLLDHKERDVRHDAALALVSVGRPGIDRLASALKSGSEGARSAAAFALGRSKHQDAVAMLVEALADPAARREAAGALMRLKWEPQSDRDRLYFAVGRRDWRTLDGIASPPREAVDQLLTDPDSTIRANIAELAGKKKLTEAVDALGRLLRTEFRWRVRQEAAKALGAIGGEAAAEHLVPSLLDARDRVRFSARRALLKLDWEPATLEERVWLAVASHSSDNVAELPAEAVPLIVPLMRAEDPVIRRVVVSGLARIGGEAVLASLEFALTDSDSYVRKRGASALLKRGWVPADDARKITFMIAAEEWEKMARLGAGAVPHLVEALANDDHEIRHNAAKVLGEIGDARAVQPLITALGDRYIAVVVNASGALALLGDDRAVDALLPIAFHHNKEIRGAAHGALIRFGPKAVSRLVANLMKEDSETQHAAARILAEIGRPSVDALVGVLERSTSETALERAAWALSEISGEMFLGRDPKKWRAWQETNPVGPATADE